ncbi:hyalin-like [Anneissia japonica]|uniref:hyalin-like n=1 Tax=Anneissia japonica TaxID=1529436 RepID=UPI0014259986|nr:hyalin-like [Anneissia japonica]
METLTLLLHIFISYLGLLHPCSSTYPMLLTEGYQGRVEIFYNDEWGTVCDDRFAMQEAHVVCRQLGFLQANTFNVAYGGGSGTILMDDVNCDGTESYIWDCDFNGWGVHNCEHWEDIGVVCDKPIMTCPSDTTVDTDMGSATKSIDYSGDISATSSSEAVPFIVPGPAEIFPVTLVIGPTTFSFTATDTLGNNGSCTFTVTVQDIEKPTLTCPSNVTVGNDMGATTASVDYSASINASDNTGDVITILPDPSTTFPTNVGMGTNLFVFTATDSSGNNDTCTFSITVQDIVQPTLTCPPDTIVNTDMGAVTASVDYSGVVIASDNTGYVPNISPDPTATFPVNLGMGANIYTFTATDLSGNIGSCTFTITVQDSVNPAITCPFNATVDTDLGVDTASVDYSGSINGSDNTGVFPTISPDPAASFPTTLGIGPNTFTFTATDLSGNNGTCTFTITVQDIVRPALTCPSDMTIDSDLGVATALVDHSGSINGSDNTGVVPIISPDPTALFPTNIGIGTNRFSFTATDPSGNNGTCMFTITVQDIVQPTLLCPSDTTVDTDMGAATASVNYSGSITGSDNTGLVPTISPDPTETFPAAIGIGTHTFTFTATDSSGNTDTCTFSVTVQGQ